MATRRWLKASQWHTPCPAVAPGVEEGKILVAPKVSDALGGAGAALSWDLRRSVDPAVTPSYFDDKSCRKSLAH